MGTFANGESGSSVRTKINTAIEKTEGTSAISTIDVDGGAIDGVTLGTNSAVTEAQVDNININGNTISSTDTNGDVTIDPNGAGDVNIGNFKFDADQTVGAGQDNYVLTYDNSGGKISLEAAAGGGGGGDMTLISTTNITSSVASVDISLSSSHSVQMMVIHNLDVSSGTRIRYRVSDDNGASFESTSSYWTIGENRYVYAGGGASGVLTNGGYAAQDTGLIGRLTNSFDDFSARVMIYNSQESSVPTTLQSDAAGGGSSTVNYSDCASSYGVNSVITDIRLLSESGNLTKGVIKLYGLS